MVYLVDQVTCADPSRYTALVREEDPDSFIELDLVREVHERYTKWAESPARREPAAEEYDADTSQETSTEKWTEGLTSRTGESETGPTKITPPAQSTNASGRIRLFSFGWEARDWRVFSVGLGIGLTIAVLTNYRRRGLVAL